MIRKLPQGTDNILAYEAYGMLTDGENQQAIREIREAISEHGKIRLFIRLPETPAIDTAVVENRIRFVWNNVDDIEKYALVGNRKVIEQIGQASRKIEFRHFRLGDESDAWEWLKT